MKEVMKQYFQATHLIVNLIEFTIKELYVQKNIFDETNFMTSEQETSNFKIGLANLEDDEDVPKEQDQREIGEQQIQE